MKYIVSYAYGPRAWAAVVDPSAPGVKFHGQLDVNAVSLKHATTKAVRILYEKNHAFPDFIACRPVR